MAQGFNSDARSTCQEAIHVWGLDVLSELGSLVKILGYAGSPAAGQK